MIILKRIIDDGQEADHRTDFQSVEIAGTVVDEYRQLRFGEELAVGFVIPRIPCQYDDVPIVRTRFPEMLHHLDDMEYLRILPLALGILDDVAFRGERRGIQVVPLDEPVGLIIFHLPDLPVHDAFEHRIRQIDHFAAGAEIVVQADDSAAAGFAEAFGLFDEE